MNLKSLSDKNLLESIKSLVKDEREITLKVLHHLREVEKRSLFAKLGYSSLFEYVVTELKYTKPAAYRRINSMRLLNDIPARELPEVEKKIEEGILSLSALSQAQTFFRQENTTREEKREIMSSLENKSVREVEKELISRASEPIKLIREKLRHVSQSHSELKFLIEQELLNEIEELKNLLSHKKPCASHKDVISYAIKELLKNLRPKAPKDLTAKKVGPAPDLKSRYIPQEVKRTVWARDGGQCKYTHQQTNKKCCCKHGLEFDHIIPYAMAGENSVENLRLRCRAHNQLAAIDNFGRKKMSEYVLRMR